MKENKPFKKLGISKYFLRDFEKIQSAFRLSSSLHRELKDTRACGDEVEIAIRDFFKEHLYPKYHISDGHIIDKNLISSSQLDLIISDRGKNPTFCTIANNSEIVFYESVYAIGEIKKSYYNKNLLNSFGYNIKRIKTQLLRDNIPADYAEISNVVFSIGQKATDYPYRNPLLAFMLFVDCSGLDLKQLKQDIKAIGNIYMPNYLVFLNLGIVINVNKKLYRQGRVKINLYPEFEEEESIWVLLNWDDGEHVLTYQYMLLLEHLNNTIVSIPDLKEYTKNIFDFDINNFEEL